MSGGLYNMVVRANPVGRMLFVTIGLDPAAVPRLRDVWINRELTEVTVFTRTGGGNRPEYSEANALLVSHPGFLRDRDWAVDSTYAEWVFSVPENRTAILRQEIDGWPADTQDTILRAITEDASSKWTAMMARLGGAE